MNELSFTPAKAELHLLKKKLLAWAQGFKLLSFYNSNQYKSDPYSAFDLLLGVSNTSLQADQDIFTSIQEAHSDGHFLMGFFSYEMKDHFHSLNSSNDASINWPLNGFFIPEIIITLKDNRCLIRSSIDDPEQLMNEINSIEVDISPNSDLKWDESIGEEQYVSKVKALQEEIRSGATYEINFCQEFTSQSETTDTEALYWELNSKSEAPFSCYMKWDDKHLLCSSPERYLAKRGNKLITQPIKGTIKRGETEQEDQLLKEQLSSSEKDRAENIMIMDLSRNDLARSCKTASVKVDELCEVYPFKTVHQMISTITGQVEDGLEILEPLKRSFPMGSMTGAPKKRTMELIEKYEESQRGLFSGTVGYIDPNGDFDFNVVIRSVSHNAVTGTSSYHAGGAITIDSDPVEEYQECLLKARLINRDQ